MVKISRGVMRPSNPMYTNQERLLMELISTLITITQHGFYVGFYD
jgi:hypothetical protein